VPQTMVYCLLENYIRAGYPAIAITTPEEGRAIDECRRVANALQMTVATWSMTQGLMVNNQRTTIQDPVTALQAASKLQENTLYILLDFHPFLRSPDVWRTAKDMFAVQKQRGIVYVFISIDFELPRELQRERNSDNFSFQFTG